MCACSLFSQSQLREQSWGLEAEFGEMRGTRGNQGRSRQGERDRLCVCP